MKIVLNLPFHGCPPNPAFVSQEAIMSLCATAEEAGFGGVSLTEHPAPSEAWRQAGGHDALDPFVGLAFAAAATKKLRLFTYLIVLPYRNPFVTAKAAASLDALSGGMLDLGLGAGYLKSEFFALGVKFDERNELFDEAIKVMKMAWTGEPVTYEGKHFSAKAVTSQPRPAQRPHPALWIGGNSKLAQRRVAEQAQGWLAMPSTPEQAKTRRSTAMVTLKDLEGVIAGIRDHAKSIGRTEPIQIIYPLGGGHSGDESAAGQVAFCRSLSDLGVTWSSWTGHAETLAGLKDEIKRAGDEIISKLPK
jgi:probable F420-dependent oxidoreductase